MGGSLWQWLTETFGALTGTPGQGWKHANDAAFGAAPTAPARAAPAARAPVAAAPQGGGQFGPTTAPVSSTGFVAGSVASASDWRDFIAENGRSAARAGIVRPHGPQ